MKDYNEKLIISVVNGIIAVVLVIVGVILFDLSQNYKWDLNKDGYVNNKDLKLIEAHLNGHIELSGNMLIKADLNKDGEITLLDLAIMKSELLERGITNE